MNFYDRKEIAYHKDEFLLVCDADQEAREVRDTILNLPKLIAASGFRVRPLKRQG
jgi:hypothetical protein